MANTKSAVLEERVDLLEKEKSELQGALRSMASELNNCLEVLGRVNSKVADLEGFAKSAERTLKSMQDQYGNKVTRYE